MNTGSFIVFEGGEGSGKTEHIQRTAAWLSALGKTVYTTHEPGGTMVGKQIRELILEPSEDLAPLAELFLFLSDRAQHVAQEILPRIGKGEIVLCDRFTGSTLAYQLGGRNIADEAAVVAAERLARNGVEPNLVVFLDVDPEIGLSRKQKQGGEEITRFEESDISFHRDIRSYFTKLASIDSAWQTIDASKTVDEVQPEIEALIQTHFSL